MFAKLAHIRTHKVLLRVWSADQERTRIQLEHRRAAFVPTVARVLPALPAGRLLPALAQPQYPTAGHALWATRQRLTCVPRVRRVPTRLQAHPRAPHVSSMRCLWQVARTASVMRALRGRAMHACHARQGRTRQHRAMLPVTFVMKTQSQGDSQGVNEQRVLCKLQPGLHVSSRQQPPVGLPSQGNSRREGIFC